MPTLDAYPDTTNGRLLVVTDWGDVPSATCVQVRRVHANGTKVPLRTYVWPCTTFGEYQHLSGGWAGFFDTEAPLDVAFSYEVDAFDVFGNPVLSLGEYIYDQFDRSVASGDWGTPSAAPVGAGWTFNGGIAADYNVAPNRGRFSHGSYNVTRFQLLGGVAWREYEAQFRYTAVGPSNGVSEVWLMGTRTGTNDFTSVRVLVRDILTSNDVTIQSRQTVAGVPAGNPATNIGTPYPGSVTIKLRSLNGVVSSKAWYGSAEPDYQNLFTLTGGGITLAPGGFGIMTSVTAGTTTPTPLLMDASEFYARRLDPGSTVRTVTSGPYTLSSNGDFWLRDPTRPCNDQRIGLCFDPTDPACTPGLGIFLAGISPDSYGPNSASFLPTNARHPIPVSRTRRDAEGAINLVTRTFPDRDAVLALTEPGSPLFFAAPPAYGIPDRYLNVGVESVSPGLPDLTFSPRLIQLPFGTVARQPGPSQGVCGSRFGDLCDLYATWDLAAASGLSYATLVTGTPAALGFRTWADVNATWASWAAVLAAEPTWAQVLVP